MIGVAHALHKNVLWLEVFVYEVLGVTISHCLQHFINDRSHLFLTKDGRFLYHVKQFTTSTELCNHIDLLLILIGLIQRDDIRMIQRLEQLHLLEHLLLILLGQSVLLTDLDGSTLSRRLMVAEVDVTVLALADHLLDIIVILYICDEDVVARWLLEENTIRILLLNIRLDRVLLITQPQNRQKFKATCLEGKLLQLCRCFHIANCCHFISLVNSITDYDHEACYNDKDHRDDRYNCNSERHVVFLLDDDLIINEVNPVSEAPDCLDIFVRICD